MNLFKSAVILSAILISATQAKEYTVTTTKDRGAGSFRFALIKANKYGKPSTIKFKLGKKDRGYTRKQKCWVIKPEHELPVITTEVHIDGYSQSCASPNSHNMDQSNNAYIAVELKGPGRCTHHKGLVFGEGSDNSSLSGLAINSYKVGVEIASHNVHVHGCFLGVDAKACNPVGTKTAVYIAPSATGTLIGGGEPHHRTLIAGKGCHNSQWGALTNHGNGTTVQGTTVNLKKSGDATYCQSGCTGIVSSCVSGTTLGGPELNQRVVCAGYQNNILFDTTTNDTLCNVYAGTDVTGTHGLGGGNGLTVVYHKVDLPDSVVGGHEIKKSLFSGHENCGILLGDEGDVQSLNGVSITDTKTGSDSTGELPIPNGKHGICIHYAIDTYIHNVITRFNLINGVFQGVKPYGTVIGFIDTSYNIVGGIHVDGPKRPADEFEGQVAHTTIIGNGNNAMTSPCGVIKTLN